MPSLHIIYSATTPYRGLGKLQNHCFYSHLSLVLILEPLVQCVAVELQRPL